MATYSNHVPSGVQEYTRYNYQTNSDGSSLEALTQLSCNNPNSTAALMFLWLTLNSGDTNGPNNTQGWRGDGKNADIFLDTRPLWFPPGNSTVDVNSFYDGIYSGYGVMSLWFAAGNFSNITLNWYKSRTKLTKA